MLSFGAPPRLSREGQLTVCFFVFIFVVVFVVVVFFFVVVFSTGHTVEPRFNEVPRDWGNWFVISRVRYAEVLSIHYAITRLKNIVRYTEELVI